MRVISTQTDDAWRSAWKGGLDRPMVRATVQRLDVRSYKYDLANVDAPDNSTMTGTGVFTSALFGQDNPPVELPNIKSVRWNRNTKQDTATCEIELFNTEILPLGGTPDPGTPTDFERPGYFTHNRGISADSQSLWGQTTNGWKNLLVPDRIIRTFEGYGFDANETPEHDPYLYPSGVWLIDDVDYTMDGIIKLTCRDIGRLLLDQMMFPPVVPFNQYPLWWSTYLRVKNPNRTVYGTSTGWTRPTYDTDSNQPYVGRGISDGGKAYVDSNGAVRGHHGQHAVDSSKLRTYWLSVGNYPNWSSAYEYLQAKFSSRTLRSVRIRTFGGPYTYFVSVYADGAWQGRHKIPYKSRMVDTNADIKFVKTGRISKDQELVISLPKAYANATKVRITFTDLYDTGIGRYRWRAGLRDLAISSTVTTSSVVSGGYRTDGNYGDYTDIIKWLCAWGGFFWPPDRFAPRFLNLDGSSDALPGDAVRAALEAERVLPIGSVWGFFEQTMTAGKVDLGVELWDKKSLMEGISYIRDIMNFLFYIDERGSVVWRSPNIWGVGNWITPASGIPTTTAALPGPPFEHTTDMIEINESETMLGLAPKISSRNVRERVFVANSNGKYGAMAAGYNPVPSGIRRVAGWTDQNFQTEEECQVMADLITVRQMFTYRTNTVEIPGNPAIQIDDQVRLIERTTSETYVHYVDGISSEFDMTTGRWIYSLQTCWLGEEAFASWAFDANELSAETKAYLKMIGRL